MQTPQRVRVFLWLLWQEWILTNGERVRRHIADKGHCVRCGYPLETNLHAIRDCAFSKAVWKTILPNSVSTNFFSSSLHDWISQNLNSVSIVTKSRGQWASQFAIVYWLLWKCWNGFIFKNCHSNFDSIVSSSLVWTENLVSSRVQAVHLIQTSSDVHWRKLELGWVK